MNLASNVKITRVKNAEAAAQTAINSTGVDMTGFDGVVFLVAFGAITGGGVQSVNAAQGADNSADWVDLEGSKITVADDDDNQVVVLDIYKPKDRYVRCEVARATQDSVVDGIIAIQYGPRVVPTENGATVVSTEVHASPAEGTA